jgi:hypothetical protein
MVQQHLTRIPSILEYFIDKDAKMLILLSYFLSMVAFYDCDLKLTFPFTHFLTILESYKHAPPLVFHFGLVTSRWTTVTPASAIPSTAFESLLSPTTYAKSRNIQRTASTRAHSAGTSRSTQAGSLFLMQNIDPAIGVYRDCQVIVSGK